MAVARTVRRLASRSIASAVALGIFLTSIAPATPALAKGLVRGKNTQTVDRFEPVRPVEGFSMAPIAQVPTTITLPNLAVTQTGQRRLGLNPADIRSSPSLQTSRITIGGLKPKARALDPRGPETFNPRTNAPIDEQSQPRSDGDAYAYAAAQFARLTGERSV
jgi:hypothetical protein